MRRLAAALLGLILMYNAVDAEQFGGRALLETDGRADTETAAPLVIVLHGFTGLCATRQRKTDFDALARKSGFIVAYPNGTARRWRYGPEASNWRIVVP